MVDSSEFVTQHFEKLRMRTDLSMEKLAQAMDYSGASSIQRYFDAAQYKGGYFRRSLVARIEKALLGKGNPPITRKEIWALAGPEYQVLPPPNAEIVETDIEFPTRLIPVYGTAVGGVDGEFDMNGQIVDNVICPPSLEHVREPFAVRIAGDSMSPRYDENDVVYINPDIPVRKGDYVIAEIQEDEHGPRLAYVKQLVKRNTEVLILHQFNPAKDLEFDGRHVVAVHAIAWVKQK